MATAQASGESAAALWSEIGRTVADGKLVRPALLLAVAASTGHTATGSDASDPDHPAQSPPGTAVHPHPAAVELATAIELLHKAFLLHDDVIDHDTLRRGEPNLIAAFAFGGRSGLGGPDIPRDAPVRTEVGAAAGILAGDLLLAKAHDLVARINLPASTRARLLDTLDETIQHSVSGELDDVVFAQATDRPALPRVRDMLHAKTGMYTVRLPILWALALTDTPTPTAPLERYSRSLGLAFQLQDDLLGLFGTPTTVGKDPLSDLREGKFTAVIAHARNTDDWPRIEPQLGRADLSEAEGAALRDLIDRSGARSRTEAELASALADARAAAGHVPPYTQVLTDLVDSLEGRRG